MNGRKSVLLALLLSLVLLPFAGADLGPKPQAWVSVTLDSQPIPGNFPAALLYCPDAMQKNLAERDSENFFNGSYLKRLSQVGLPYGAWTLEAGGCKWIPAPFAWGGECSNSGCSFGYSIPSRFRFAAYLPQQNRVFFTRPVDSQNQLDNFLNADLKSSGEGTLSYSAISGLQALFSPRALLSLAFALAITLVIECILAAVYFRFKKMDLENVRLVAVANLVSLPLLWFGLHLLSNNFSAALFAGEAMVIILEARILNQLSKESISFQQAMFLSLGLNVASFLFGTMLPIFILGY